MEQPCPRSDELVVGESSRASRGDLGRVVLPYHECLDQGRWESLPELLQNELALWEVVEAEGARQRFSKQLARQLRMIRFDTRCGASDRSPWASHTAARDVMRVPDERPGNPADRDTAAPECQERSLMPGGTLACGPFFLARVRGAVRNAP